MQQRLDCARQALTEAQVTENGKDGMQTPCGVKVGDSTPPPAPVDEPPAKKARIDMEFIAADQLPGQSITTVPAAGLKKGETGKIHVRSGLRIYFENSSEAALQLKVGYIFGSLGGGAFKLIKPEGDGSPGAVDTSKRLL